MVIAPTLSSWRTANHCGYWIGKYCSAIGTMRHFAAKLKFCAYELNCEYVGDAPTIGTQYSQSEPTFSEAGLLG
jgi:hypothetical protein